MAINLGLEGINFREYKSKGGYLHRREFEKLVNTEITKEEIRASIPKAVEHHLTPTELPLYLKLEKAFPNNEEKWYLYEIYHITGKKLSRIDYTHEEDIVDERRAKRYFRKLDKELEEAINSLEQEFKK